MGMDNPNENQTGAQGPETETGKAPAVAEAQTGTAGGDLESVMARADVQAQVQAIADRRVQQAIETAKRKWENEQTAQASEAAKLAKMTEAEKAQYQFQKDKAEFERQKAEFDHKQLQLETARQMTAAGLPDLSAYVTGRDAEATAANIPAVTQALSVWEKARMNAAMRGTVPTEGQPADKIPVSSLKGKSEAEINKLWHEGRIDMTR